MMKLIHANFARMIKNRIFWLSEAFLAGYSVFVYLMAARNLKLNPVAVNWNLYFFNAILVIGVVIAVFSVFFIGVEYSDGTIRNKLIIGHKRREIYLANVLVCFTVGMIQFLTCLVVSAVSGTLIIGTQMLALHEPGWCMLHCVMIIAAYAAVFCMIAMLDTNKARAVLEEILVAAVFLILTLQIYGDLTQPEYTNRTALTQEGGFQVEENIPNPKYVTGNKRVLYEWIDAFLPADQAMYVIDSEAVYSLRAPCCLFFETVVLIMTGAYVFQKKDIK